MFFLVIFMFKNKIHHFNVLTIPHRKEIKPIEFQFHRLLANKYSGWLRYLTFLNLFKLPLHQGRSIM